MTGRNQRENPENKGGFAMARKYIDCRDYPQGEKKCSVAISADSAEEVVEAAVQHGIAVHGYPDTSEFRDQIRQNIKEGHPSP
jgi:predicted small metal-binding protein